MYIYSVLALVFYSILRFLMALERNNQYGRYPMDHPIDVGFSQLLKMAIDIVDLPMNFAGGFPSFFVGLLDVVTQMNINSLKNIKHFLAPGPGCSREFENIHHLQIIWRCLNT